MTSMKWTVEQHGTNVAFADDEHKNVFKNLNILYDLRKKGAGSPEIAEQTDVVLRVVAAHFAHEEQEMQAKNFAGYERHKAEHDDLINTCTAMETKIKAGELELSKRLCKLIKRWFDSHIPEYDRAYSQVLNN
jgi:hemerythrin